LLSLPAGTEMFHFPALPHPALCVQAGATAIYDRRVSPFGHPRITVWLPTPRGLSQAPTSFIGSWCQGIHRAPLVTWQTLQIQMLRVHYAVLKIRTALSPTTTTVTAEAQPNRRPRASAQAPPPVPSDTQQRAHPATATGGPFHPRGQGPGTY
jgi:hypothetical protein